MIAMRLRCSGPDVGGFAWQCVNRQTIYCENFAGTSWYSLLFISQYSNGNNNKTKTEIINSITLSFVVIVLTRTFFDLYNTFYMFFFVCINLNYCIEGNTKVYLMRKRAEQWSRYSFCVADVTISTKIAAHLLRSRRLNTGNILWNLESI